MNEDDIPTRKLKPIKRRVRIEYLEELEAYEELRQMAERAGPLGHTIQGALLTLVTLAGTILVKVKDAA